MPVSAGSFTTLSAVSGIRPDVYVGFIDATPHCFPAGRVAAVASGDGGHAASGKAAGGTGIRDPC